MRAKSSARRSASTRHVAGSNSPSADRTSYSERGRLQAAFFVSGIMRGLSDTTHSFKGARGGNQSGDRGGDRLHGGGTASSARPASRCETDGHYLRGDAGRPVADMFPSLRGHVSLCVFGSGAGGAGQMRRGFLCNAERCGNASGSGSARIGCQSHRSRCRLPSQGRGCLGEVVRHGPRVSGLCLRRRSTGCRKSTASVSAVRASWQILAVIRQRFSSVSAPCGSGCRRCGRSDCRRKVRSVRRWPQGRGTCAFF
jgi:hypothetical protein